MEVLVLPQLAKRYFTVVFILKLRFSFLSRMLCKGYLKLGLLIARNLCISKGVYYFNRL